MCRFSTNALLVKVLCAYLKVPERHASWFQLHSLCQRAHAHGRVVNWLPYWGTANFIAEYKRRFAILLDSFCSSVATPAAPLHTLECISYTMSKSATKTKCVNKDRPESTHLILQEG